MIRWQPGALDALRSRAELQAYALDPARRTPKARTRIEGPRRKLCADTYVHRHAVLGPRILYRGYELARYDPAGLVLSEGWLLATPSERRAIMPRLAEIVTACTDWDWYLGTITSPLGARYTIEGAAGHRFCLKYKEASVAQEA